MPTAYNNVSPTVKLLADAVNEALATLEGARAKLHVAVLTGGTVERPALNVRTIGGVVYGSWTDVPAPVGWHRWKALGFGTAADVAAYNAAADELDARVKALLAAAA